jgi:hypothetical protein
MRRLDLIRGILAILGAVASLAVDQGWLGVGDERQRKFLEFGLMGAVFVVCWRAIGDTPITTFFPRQSDPPELRRALFRGLFVVARRFRYSTVLVLAAFFYALTAVFAGPLGLCRVMFYLFTFSAVTYLRQLPHAPWIKRLGREARSAARARYETR